MKVTLQGMEDAEKQMERIEKGSKAMGNYNAWVYNNLPYAYGAETGRHRKKNKLARKAGGSFYMRRAINTVLSDADRDLSEGLNKVTAPGVWVLKRLGLWARRVARKNAPRSYGVKGKKKKRNYRLWRSTNSNVRKK